MDGEVGVPVSGEWQPSDDGEAEPEQLVESLREAVGPVPSSVIAAARRAAAERFDPPGGRRAD